MIMTTLPFNIDIAVQCADWKDALSDIDGLAERSLAGIMAQLEAPKHGELSIALIDDVQIRTLNRDFRHKDKPTNVLSFPNDGPAPLLGDIVLAFETVTREADEKSISLEHHIAHLLIHGFLHLQGYDHETEADAAEMEALEITALASLNIDNPYEIQD